METEEAPDVIEDMSAHLTAIVVSEQADPDEVEGRLVGEDGGMVSVTIKQERPDETAEPPGDDDDDDDVICIDSETTVKYLTGKMSFEEFSALLDEQVKTEVEDDAQKTPGSQPEAAASTSAPVSVKTTRVRRSKLPRHLQGLMGEANMKFARGEMDEATKMCMEIIRLAPTAPEPFQTLAMLCEESGEAKKALQYSLIAAYLNPLDVEEWVRMAELSLEHGEVEQAISCYSKAVKADGKNVELWWARCRLLERVGEVKRAMEGYGHILTLLPRGAGERYMTLAKDVTKYFHEKGEVDKAMATMSTAFELHTKFVSAEDVNVLLELFVFMKMYRKPLEVLVQHCGVVLHYADGRTLAATENSSAVHIGDDSPKLLRCDVPNELPVDLRCKLIVCMINLEHKNCISALMKPLLTEDPEEVGDLYLDVAEAHMENGQYKEAKMILASLVKSTNYNLAAVWLRYGECLNCLSELHEAVGAYKQVVTLAPSHSAARVTLSTLQQQLGRHDEALQALEPEISMDVEEVTPVFDLRLLLPRCHLLYTQQKKPEFIECCRLMLFGHFSKMLSRKHITVILSNRSLRHRMQSLRPLLGTRFEQRLKGASTQMAESNITVSDLWGLFLKLCDVLVELKRFQEFEDVSSFALVHTEFMADQDKQMEVDFICLIACLLNNNGRFAYSFIKELCIKNLHSSRAWNVFCHIITISEDIRHNRFCMRLLMKQPDHVALQFLNGHNAMIAGTYKHALGEYVAALKQNPADPLLSLCIGITFVHMACQKFASRRHALVVQGCTFLNQYMELRGDCQEASYNVGRAMHQLGLFYAAVYHYEKALSLPPAITGKEEELFDLRREAAFNLTLIYQQSGSHDLANLLRQRYLVI